MAEDNKALTITDADFEKQILKADFALVDFWAEWCAPCKQIGPIVNELAEEYKGQVVIGKMDVDSNSEIPSKYGIRSIPTLIFFKKGKEVDKKVGSVRKEDLKKFMDKNLTQGNGSKSNE